MNEDFLLLANNSAVFLAHTHTHTHSDFSVGGVMEKGGVKETSTEMLHKTSDELPVSELTAATHVCKVCGMCFETKGGFSSHARSHLRQLGVCMPDSRGDPISLLHDLISEKDGALPSPLKHTHNSFKKHTTHTQHRAKHTSKHGARHGSGTKLKIKITLSKQGAKQKTDTHLDLNFSVGGVMEKGGVKETSTEMLHKTSDELPVSELTAATHVCKVCGMCFETKGGFSSHARSHLRQLGVCMPDSRGDPISLLHDLISEKDGALPSPLKHTHNSFKKHTTHTQHRAKHTSKHGARHGSGTKHKSKIALSKQGAKQKTDTHLDLNISQRDCVHVCELCGVCYETKKGLSSHARAHLHHFGVKLDPKASPIQVLHDLLQKKAGPVDKNLPTALLTSSPFKKKKKKLLPAREKTLRDRGLSKNVRCEFCGENFKKTQSLASHARSHLRQLGVTDWTAHGSPMATLRELMARRTCSSLPHPTQTTPFTLANPPSEAPHLPVSGLTSPQFSKHHSEAPPNPVPGPAPVRVPKARKGSRMAVSKLKEEPMEFEISTDQSTQTKPPPLTISVKSAADLTPVPFNQNLSTGAEVGVAEPVRCDYCSDLFDSRKALSCHARAHLRQLGVKWAPFASPIDTLHELMIRVGRGQGSEGTPSPVDLYKEKTDTDGAGLGEATCELCGFDFENRKALASHARAHLRQQGEQWSSSQSPIAALSQWMSREPEKVAVLHKLYMQGTFPHIRKRRVCFPIRSSGADSAHSGVSHPFPAACQGKTGAGLSCSSNSHRKLSSHRPTPYTSVDHGSDHRTPKRFPLRAESLKRVGNAPSLVPRPPETSLVKLVGKIYSLKCRFCEQVFSGPLSVQEDWLIHLQHHILNLKPDRAHSPAPILHNSDSAQLIGQAV
ncbi:protein Wiz isoform X2 [Silurus meridionalis]|uniref:protein Wiz isoform X2 n=1 Tax=Silurus meridionalis TaxID=175797 RepID=UPI001EECCFB3|nr:protein Wiz isoform X2 [Silurus meridionalis]